MICVGWPPHLAWEAAPGLCVACEAKGFRLVSGAWGATGFAGGGGQKESAPEADSNCISIRLAGAQTRPEMTGQGRRVRQQQGPAYMPAGDDRPSGGLITAGLRQSAEVPARKISPAGRASRAMEVFRL